MKKFLVSLLGIFMLFGASLFVACEKDNPRLSLSADSVEIELYSQEEDDDYAVVTATLSGAKDGSIRATALSGYENIVKITYSSISSDKISIKIEGISEGRAQVVVRANPGNIVEYIDVNVFSIVNSMSQRQEKADKKENFLLRGRENILDENKLIEFQPSSKSLRTLTYALSNETSKAGLTLDGNKLTIDNSFVGDEVKIDVTTENDVQTTLTLPVLDEIDENVTLKFSYSKNNAFTEVNEDNNNFNIVPNLPSDEHYQGYIAVDHAGQLQIEPYVIGKNGAISYDLVVVESGTYEDKPLFTVYAAKDKTNINSDYKIGFNIGYASYKLSIDTMQIMPITIQARELVNGITISSADSTNIAGTTQTLYTSYADDALTTAGGQRFDISITPTTVIGMSNKYSITLSRNVAGGNVSDGCPIEICYRDPVNDSNWVTVPLIEQPNGDYATREGESPNAKTLYIKASNNITQQTVDGYSLTFTSDDNRDISTSFNLKLVKSVSLSEFVFEDADFSVDSSSYSKVYKKQFTLRGQSSIDGLYIINNSRNVAFNEITTVSSDYESVTFEISFTLLDASYGVTSLDYYQIAHKNGLVSERFKLDIFLPFKDSSMVLDIAQNKSNSVINYSLSNNVFNTQGSLLSSASASLDKLILKNNTTTPLLYNFNTVGNKSAVANISVYFYDYAPEGDLARFKSLMHNEVGQTEIIGSALLAGDTSNIAMFNAERNAIITKGVGHTYGVVAFTGKGIGEGVDDNGYLTLLRIIYIESLVTPDRVDVLPEADENVTLYSSTSLASQDEALSRKTIKIKFAKNDITYKSRSNLVFVSNNSLMGDKNVSDDGNVVTWSEGRYSLSNVNINSEGISFDIIAIETFGQHIFNDTINVYYVIYDDEGNKIYEIFTSINVTIKNAQRVESVKLLSNSEDGLYFEVGDTRDQYLIFNVSPTNAKNNNLVCFVIDLEGRENRFITPSYVEANIVGLNLADEVQQRMKGAIYVISQDAIYNNQIRYYYLDGGVEKEGAISQDKLAENYEFLVTRAYFKSNASEGAAKNVDFANILIKIDVVVADGSDFEYAYRIFDNEGFRTIRSDKYYTVMNNLDLTGYSYAPHESFAGGLQGKNENITIKFDGANFASELATDAKIRKLTFIGNVEGYGFIVDNNKGQISNVTIDVNGFEPSILTTQGNGGGVAGENTGKIQDAKVYGLQINGNALTESYVGGVVGVNMGQIAGAKVEIYNLLNTGSDKELVPYKANTMTGKYVGGLVGRAGTGTKIETSYIYDYTIDQTNLAINMSGTVVGAFVGKVDDETTIEVNKCFSVTNVRQLAGNGNLTAKDSYIGYYDAVNGYSVQWYDETGANLDIGAIAFTSGSFVKEGDVNYKAYVNGGRPHLKDIYQAQKVDNVDYDIATSIENDYYKSLACDSGKGILMLYQLKNSNAELSSSEANDLTALNTISLAQVLGEENLNSNIIATSSNTKVLKTLGSSLLSLKEGQATLTLASKQDVSLRKEIEIQVIYALSRLQISWTEHSGKTNIVEDGQIHSLQKTKSRTFNLAFDKAQVYLGSLATARELMLGNTTFDVKTDPQEGNVLTYELFGNNLKVLSASDSIQTDISIAPKVNLDDVYNNAIKAEFKRQFTIRPIDGVISFGISENSLPLTPSTNGAMSVRIRTTDSDDSVYPVISFNSTSLHNSFNEERGVYEYTLEGKDEPILQASVERVGEVTEGALNTYTYEIIFAVCPDARAGISDDMQFEVYIMSKSGNSSLEWGGEFTLSLTKQNFTNIDVTNKKISSTEYGYQADGSLVQIYDASMISSVLAPGNSSILEVSVNPIYAYYDYVEITSSGATVSNAVNIELMEQMAGSSTKFTRKISRGNIETIAGALRFTPSNSEKSKLFYKLWINTTVNRDSTLQFRVTFYQKGGQYITHVNYFLTVSYLTEPEVTIDGAKVAYLAKGMVSTVKIDVLMDQEIENLSLQGDKLEGITLSQPTKLVPDEVRGIKTCTAKLWSSVKTEARTIYVVAQISRELNGKREIKASIASAVIVDFKLDESDIAINNSYDGEVTIWQGVPKQLSATYNLLPESYNVATDEETQDALRDINKARNTFLGAGYYPARETSSADDIKYEALTGNALNEYDYYINYKYDQDRKLVKASLEDRLFIISGNTRVPITDTSVEKPFMVDFIEDTNTLTFIGTKINSGVRMVLETYVSTKETTKQIDTYFTLKVNAYSDEDLPLIINSAADFLALDPAKYTSSDIQAKDYILTTNILLENYTPFSTDLISSLDGNGYTIYIKSFNTNIDSSNLNVGLFTTVNRATTLKNVRVNLYNAGQLTVDVNKFTDSSIAGFAIENDGIITNCEVVSFYSEDYAIGLTENLNLPACDKHSNAEGLNVKYIRGNNTTEEVYLSDSPSWTTETAGFVIRNNGSITNSRVGGKEITILGEEQKSNGQSIGVTFASHITLNTFNIIGQGNIAGFVLYNTSGNISTCYVQNADIENKSASTSYFTSGFVGVNDSSINISYISGVPTDTSSITDEDALQRAKFTNEGSSIKSKAGCIAGFAYRNEGVINDSYSNILIANSDRAEGVYLASGFVYENLGTIENAYSASQIKNSMNTQMNFSGVDKNGQLLARGKYINCYFYNKAFNDEALDSSTETQNDTGAMLITAPDDASMFYGFALASGDNDGIWKVTEGEGIRLIATEQFTFSHRYIYYIDKNIFEGIAGEDEKGSYILPYAKIRYVDTASQIDTALGGAFNPIIIADAQDFMQVSGTSNSSYIKEYYSSSAMWGTYRLVNNIDLTSSTGTNGINTIPSSTKAFSGTLYGNNFTIRGISLASAQPDVAFGLFASIEKRGRGSTPKIIDLNLEVSQIDGSVVSMVGALAGYIKDSIVVGINIDFVENCKVIGFNFVGGLTGFAFGDNVFRSISINNPNVVAKKYLEQSEGENNNYFISDSTGQNAKSLQALRTSVRNNLNYNTTVDANVIKSIEKYSYAGGAIGFADLFITSNKDFDINQSTNYQINNVRINGSIYVEGQVAGGIVGLTGYQTNIRDAGITIDSSSDSHIIATRYFAGGVVGQSFGALNRIFSVYDETTQIAIENNMSNFYSGKFDQVRGNLDIFVLKNNTNYSQMYVGGLIGAAFEGCLDISYSKLNVTSMTAKYAGGIVGGLILNNAVSYLISNTEDINNNQTRYLLHEVYASGDIRASEMAGGIIGRIVGQNSTVALQAVNAVNYFTTYNYTYGNYTPVENDRTNFSDTYKVNAFVGEFASVGAGGVVSRDELNDKTDATIEEYSSYIILVPVYAVSSSTSSRDNYSSVGFYEGYHKNSAGNYVKLNMFGKMEASASSEENRYVAGGLAFAISSPLNYTNASVGFSYTNVAFLGSNAWEEKNWEHKITDLFPLIKNKRTSNVLFLDCYNVEQVFEMMNNSNYTVYVRGLVSEGSDEYADVDLRGKDVLIEGFSGRLRGGVYPLDKAQKTKIITDYTFIKSVKTGFSAYNVEVEYKADDRHPDRAITGGSTSGTTSKGLFIAEPAEQISIRNLILDIKNNVEYEVGSDEKVNVGLVAPELINSSINGLVIKYNRAEALMTVKGGSATSTVERILNVGLIAGKYEQNSTSVDIAVENVKVLTSDLMTIGAKFNKYYVGGYFGQVVHNSGLDVSVDIGSIAPASSSVESYFRTTFSNDIPSDVQIIAGGYFGLVNGLNSLNLTDGNPIEATSTFVVKQTVENLTVGGVIGQISESGLEFNAGASSVSTKLVAQKVTKLDAGGVVGYAGGKFKLQGFSNVDFSVTAEESTDDIISYKQQFSYSLPDAVIATDANVGGLVGQTAAGFYYNTVGVNINALTKDKDNREIAKYIAVKAKNNNLGSAVGMAISKVELCGKIISETEFVVNGENGNVGGFIGNITQAEIAASPELGTVDQNITIGDDTSKLLFNGAVYSSAKNLIFGGNVGYYEGKNSNLSITHTLFGGAAKILGGEKVAAGGVIGQINDENANEINIAQNYTFGDVFVEYSDSFKELDDENYYFGGLIARASEKTYTILNNYSLTTAHNARYSSSVQNCTQNALFGSRISEEGSIMGSNYYSHSVALCNDEQGADASAYSTYGASFAGGYNDSKDATTVASEIMNALPETFRGTIKSGHKLSPSSLTSKYDIDSASRFNGIKYVALNRDVETSVSYDKPDVIGDNITSFGDLSSVAVVGDGRSIHYSSNKTQALFDKLTGFSSISGMALNVDMVVDNVDMVVYKKQASLATIMQENSIIYAVNVTGRMEVGGSTPALAGGMVAQFDSGKIFDCSTDLDIIYRAGAKTDRNSASAYGIAFAAVGENPKLIENTFTAGSIKTLISANACAFASGGTVKNCYTITKLDINDYTKADNASTGITSSSGVNGTNFYYDADALNYKYSTAKNGTAKTYNELSVENFAESGIFDNSSKWKTHINFNYGYPTLNYPYLNVSSYSYENPSLARPDEPSGNNYDDYVDKTSYIRRPNGYVPGDDTSTEYFNISNAAVLKQQVNSNSYGNFILRYDIDMGQTQYNDTWEELATFSGTFDGQGNTIKNVQNASLFDVIEGTGKLAEVKNLRLTNFTSDVQIKPILATKKITNAKISNITLGGSITNESALSDNAFGALTKTVTDSKLYTITNTAQIDLKCSASSVSIGGLAGTIANTTIKFCSNYGPINARASDDGKSVIVGGLVGTTNGSGAVISYSYNATSVLANYASNTAVQTTQGTFFAGGIVGNHANGNITNCHNYGMIKSGNKSNGTASYAGGIVAQAVNGASVDSCYNKGTVEALGTNPTTAWYWEKLGGKTQLVYRQTSTRNVYAYGIGYANSGTISNCEVHLADNFDFLTIHSNGSALEEDGIIYKKSLDEIQEDPQLDGMEETQSFNLFSRRWASFSKQRIQKNVVTFSTKLNKPKFALVQKIGYADTTEFTADTSKINIQGVYISGKITPPGDWKGNPTQSDIEIGNMSDLGLSSSVFKYQRMYDGKKLLTTTSQDSLGVARSVNLVLSYDYSLNITRSLDWDLDDSYEIYDDITYEAPISTGYSVYLPDNQYAKAVYFTGNMASNGLLYNSVKVAGDKEEKFKSLLSNSTSAETNTTTIAGKTYYIATSNNTAIFSSGLYSTTGKLSSNDLFYVPNRNYYTIEVLDGSGNPIDGVNASITSVSPSGRGTKVDYVVYSNAAVTNAKVKVSLNYNESFNIDLSSMSYYYHDAKSIAIDWPGLTYNALENYKLIYSGNELTSDIVELKDGDGKFVYLAKLPEYEDRYLYVPYAILEDSKGVRKQVNTDLGRFSSSDKFNDDAENIIGKLSNKTFYPRTTTGATADIDFNFDNNKYYSLNQTQSMSGGTTISETLSYGAEKAASTYIDINSVTPLGGSKYQVSLKTSEVDTIGIVGNTPVMSYSKTNSKWEVKTELFPELSDFSISFNGTDALIFQTGVAVGGGDSFDADNINTIKNYLNTNFKFVVNDFTNTITIPRLHGGLATNLTWQLKDNSGNVGGSLQVERALKYTWNTDNENISLTTNDEGIMTATCNDWEITRHFSPNYQFKGVNIWKNEINFNVSNSYTSTITKMTLNSVSGGKKIVSVSKDGTALYTSTNPFGITESHEFNDIGDNLKDLTGDITFKVDIYPSYETKSTSSKEAGNYEFLLGNSTGTYYVDIDEKGLNSITKIYTDKNLAITVEKAGTKYDYTIDNKPFYTVDGSSRYTYTWSDDDGYVQQDAGTELIYSYYDWTNNTRTEFDVLSRIGSVNALPDFDAFENIVKLNSGILTVEGGFDVLTSPITRRFEGYEYKGGATTTTFKNVASEYKSEHNNDYKMPDGTPLTLKLPYSGMTLNMTTNSKYKVVGDTISFILKGEGETTINATASKTGNCEISQDLYMTRLDAGNIILENDISFIDNPNTFNASASIIGNGYNITYFNTFFDSGIRHTADGGGFISNVNFLGVVSKDDAMISGRSTNTSASFKGLSYHNINTYGSVINSTISNAGVIVGLQSMGDIRESTKFSGYFNSYASINQYKPVLTYLVFAYNAPINNFGVIETASGKDGTHGGRTWKWGEPGRDGGSLRFTVITIGGITDENKGIIVLGKGGNGGAGYWLSYEEKSIYNRIVGKGGSAGRNGETILLNGFAGITTDGKAPQPGLDGYEQRASVKNLKFYDWVAPEKDFTTKFTKDLFDNLNLCSDNSEYTSNNRTNTADGRLNPHLFELYLPYNPNGFRTSTYGIIDAAKNNEGNRFDTYHDVGWKNHAMSMKFVDAAGTERHMFMVLVEENASIRSDYVFKGIQNLYGSKEEFPEDKFEYCVDSSGNGYGKRRYEIKTEGTDAMELFTIFDTDMEGSKIGYVAPKTT